MNQKLNVLIIEDEKNICDFISASLSAQGCRLITAQTGASGLSLAASQCPDIIPLDLGLLRSKQLTDIGDYKITGLSIRKSFQDWTGSKVYGF